MRDDIDLYGRGIDVKNNTAWRIVNEGCQRAVGPYWNTLLCMTNETCHRELPCPVHDEVDRRKGLEDRREQINHPQHYGGDTTYEAIKVIEAWGLGFCLGNAVKYICRADKKGMKLEDLRKAVWYISREIEQVEKETKK